MQENTTLKNECLSLGEILNMNKEDEKVEVSTSTARTITGIKLPGRVQGATDCAAQSLIGAKSL